MPVEEPIVDELRSTYLFASLNDTQLHTLLSGARRHQCLPGRILFAHGEKAQHFYWVRDGQIKLYRVSSSGNEKVIELVAAGEHFAEALMFMGEQSHYPVTAEAIGRAEVWSFDSRTFLALLGDSPGTAVRLLTLMSRRVYTLINEIDLLSLQTATTRVVDFLLSEYAQAGGCRVALRTTKHLLAARLSIKPETLSRIFGRLASDGLISVRKGEVLLHDPLALQAYSQAGTVQ